MNESVDDDCAIKIFLGISASELCSPGWCIEISPIISARVSIWTELWHAFGGTSGFCRDTGWWVSKNDSTTTGCTLCERIELDCVSDAAKSSNVCVEPRKFVVLNCCSDV